MFKPKTRRSRFAVFAVALLGSLAVAGVALGVALTRPDDSQTENIDVLRFDRPPLADAREVASPAAAAPELAFPPVVPREVGPPQKSWINTQSDRAHQVLALLYDDSTRGRFFVIESPRDTDVTPEGAQQSLEQMATECADPSAGCEGAWSVITLKDGTRALLIEGDPDIPDQTTSVLFYRANVLFNIVGPVATFDRSDALAVAEQFARPGN
jgi:hypothetical protein